MEIGLLAVALCLAVSAETVPPAEAPALPANLPEGWYARIETSFGTILARLLPEQAPQSVAHFAALAQGRLAWADAATGETRQGRYYDGVEVHRAVAGQSFETGDRTGTGRGFPPIYVPMEGTGPVTFDGPGRLGMIPGPAGRVSGAGFVVTAAAMPWLKNRCPCFGQLVQGRDVVQMISSVKTNPRGKPLEAVIIREIRILKAGSPPPLPDPLPYLPEKRRELSPKLEKPSR